MPDALSITQHLSFVSIPSNALLPFIPYAGGGVLRNPIQSSGWKLQLVCRLGINGRRASNVDRHRAEYREPGEKPRAGQQQYDHRQEERFLAHPREDLEEGLPTEGHVAVDRRQIARHSEAVSDEKVVFSLAFATKRYLRNFLADVRRTIYYFLS